MTARQLDVRVGDEVLVRGTVVEVIPGVGLNVELFSKTDQYHAWIREDLVADVVLPDVPDEPGDWTVAFGDDHEGPVAFRRCDAAGHLDVPVRRHNRRWWDFAARQWVDWPTAVRRGADPARALAEGAQ